MRFINNSWNKEIARISGNIQVMKLRQALFAIVRIVQRETYAEELAKLLAIKFLSKHNTLSQLSLSWISNSS